jgi:SAM-dependent methyltransferase
LITLGFAFEKETIVEVEFEIVSGRDIFAECIHSLAQRDMILDLGGRRRFHKRLGSFREIFAGVPYYCLDILLSQDLDVVGDLLSLPFESEVADGIICHAVLEHVYEPQTAVREIHRVLRPGGVAFLYVPFLYPYHGSRVEPDCYRFTRDGLLYMFRDFSEMRLQPVDSYIATTLRFMTGFTSLEKTALILADPLESLVGWLRGRPLSRETQTSGYNIWVQK